MEGIHKYTARYFYTEATFTCYFVSQNQYIFIFGKLILWNLQLNNFKTTFSSRFDELRGDFCFFKKFSKTPPKNRFPFQTSERIFNFLFKIPPFFRFPVQTSEGINFLKEIFEKSVNLGVHFYTPCPNEWKEFFLWQDYQRT